MGGEFAFVVFTEAFRHGLFDAQLRDRLVAIVGLSMAASPLILLALGNWLQHNPQKKPERDADAIDHEHPRVIIAGFGRMGQIVGRMLRAQQHPVHRARAQRRAGRTVAPLRHHDLLRRSRRGADLLRAAHAERAEVFVLTTDDPETNVRTARLLRRLYPQLKVFARARNRQHAFKLMDLGVEVAVRETFHSSLELGQHVLEALGMPRGSGDGAAAPLPRARRAPAVRTAPGVRRRGRADRLQRAGAAELEKLFEADAAPEAEAEIEDATAPKPLPRE